MIDYSSPPQVGAAPSDLPKQGGFRWVLVAVLLTAGLFWWGPAPATAQDLLEDALDDDLGLIAYADDLRQLSLGSQNWEVWVCDVGGPLNLNLQSITTLLNNQISPYFVWLSEGRYTPTFSAEGSVRARDIDSCPEQVALAGGNQTAPAIALTNEINELGGYTLGPFFEEGNGVTWIEEATVVAGGETVVTTEEWGEPALGEIAYLIGLALEFPFSYGGRVFWEDDGTVNEFDNPMDVMSEGSVADLRVGTLAINRYAAGWIDPGEVIVHQAGEGTYELSPLGVSGDQMLVIPSPGGPGGFYALGARVAKGYDQAIPTEGVEVYRIDQRVSACEERVLCWGFARRTQPVPPSEQHSTTLHVLKEGDGMDLGEVRVEVAWRTGDRFTVRVAAATGAQASPFERSLDDDLDLIAFADSLRELSLGTQEWEVWACDVGGSLFLDLPAITRFLNTKITSYFRWLSEGRYIPTFSPSGSVRAEDQDACGVAVEMAGGNQTFPALIIDNDEIGDGGWGVVGDFWDYGNSLAWIDGATAVVGGATVLPTVEWGPPVLATVPHEIGHALGLPHSYGGLNFWEGEVDEYDNPMDIMSAFYQIGLELGTVAVNRYAAGWIDPGDVAVYEAGEVSYELSPLGVSGDQMLVIPTGEGPGVFYTLGPRVAKRIDRDVPVEGVEVYLVDQRDSACEYEECWGLDRRTQPIPAGADVDSTLHVLEVGDSLDLGKVRVEVTDRSGDRFTVRVEPVG